MSGGWSSPASSPVKRPRLTQNSYTSPNAAAASQQTSSGNSARDLLSGALNEAIRSRDGRGSEMDTQLDSHLSPKKMNGLASVSKNGRPIRRRRKDPEKSSDFHHTFVMKLFDRSVDLAQFKPSTALYPVCRAWMTNEPSNTDQCPKERVPTPPPPDQPESQDDPAAATSKTSTDGGVGEKLEDIYALPRPEPVALEGHCPRVPPPRPPPVLEGVDLELEISDSTPPAILLSNHMVRWWEVRKSWRQASLNNEKRYEKSLKILKEMFKSNQFY